MTAAKKLFKKWKKDPAFQAAYKALEPEFAQAREFIAARVKSGLTQAQVAKKMKTSQPVVARIESGRQQPSLRTLRSYARAIGHDVKIELVPLER